MRFLRFLHRGEAPYVTYTALFGYVLLVIARIIDAGVSDPDTLTVLMIPLELTIFLLPATLYWFFRRRSLSKTALKLSPPALSHIPLMLTATVVLICGGVILTIALYGRSLGASSFALYDTFRAHVEGGFLSNVYLILTYAALPAACEETVYRSLMCAEHEHGGVVRAITVSSLCFGMLHFDMRLLPLYVLSGALLALAMYATHSVTVPMIIHFAYNLFGIYARPYVISFYINTDSRALFIMLVGTLFLVSAALFCYFSGKLYSRYAAERLEPSYPVALSLREILASLGEAFVSLPFILCAVIFAVAVIVF
ncbi:MAG: CPBP family intramembrane metalloprotease [Clostridia bacterium]|nr:CPBP family intramembrane metalloprotease [Clostridia bacterium]